MIFFNATVAAIQAPSLLKHLVVPQAQTVEERIVPSMPDTFEKTWLAQACPTSPIANVGRAIDNGVTSIQRPLGEFVQQRRDRGYPSAISNDGSKIPQAFSNTMNFVVTEGTAVVNQGLHNFRAAGGGVKNTGEAIQNFCNNPVIPVQPHKWPSGS